MEYKEKQLRDCLKSKINYFSADFCPIPALSPTLHRHNRSRRGSFWGFQGSGSSTATDGEEPPPEPQHLARSSGEQSSAGLLQASFMARPRLLLLHNTRTFFSHKLNFLSLVQSRSGGITAPRALGKLQ